MLSIDPTISDNNANDPTNSKNKYNNQEIQENIRNFIYKDTQLKADTQT